MLPGHHVGIGPVGRFAGHHLLPVAVAPLPGSVQPCQPAVFGRKPLAVSRQGMRAEAHQAVGLHVPAQLIPGIPAHQVGGAAVARARLAQEFGHPLPNAGVIETAARGDAKMDLVAVGGNHRATHMVDHLAARHGVVDPVGVDFGDRAQHHVQPVFVGQLHQPVVIVIIKLARFGFHPGPHHPELNGIQARLLDFGEIGFPIGVHRERRAVILHSKVHNFSSCKYRIRRKATNSILTMKLPSQLPVPPASGKPREKTPGRGWHGARARRSIGQRRSPAETWRTVRAPAGSTNPPGRGPAG